MEKESRLFLVAQFTALTTLNKNNHHSFDFILKEVDAILGVKTISWTEKNSIIRKILYQYTPYLPPNKVPSMLFEVSHSYETQCVLNHRKIYNTSGNVDCFSNIEKSQEVLALGVVNQGTKACRNFIESPFGNSKIKELIFAYTRADFSSWSGFSPTDLV